jgi:hypothetical protein
MNIPQIQLNSNSLLISGAHTTFHDIIPCNFLSIVKQLASNNITNICKSDQNKQNKILTATVLMCTVRLKCEPCTHVHNDVSKHVVLHDVMEHAVYNKIKRNTL